MIKDETTHSNIIIRLKRTDISDIDALASKYDLSRSAMIRLWIAEKLSAERQPIFEEMA